jgi:hypothetical protein
VPAAGSNHNYRLGENIMQDRKGGFEPDVRNRFINPFVRAYIRRIDELLV